jgi:hypothetical protein
LSGADREGGAVRDAPGVWGILAPRGGLRSLRGFMPHPMKLRSSFLTSSL